MRTLPTSTVGRALRARVWLIVLLPLAAALVAYGISTVRPPVFEASALLSIDESQDASQGFDVAMQADQFLTQRFITLATSREVLQAVCARERRGCSVAALARQVRVATPRATAQLEILADASSPTTAARLANEVADALIAANRAEVQRQSGAELTFLQAQLQQLGAQLSQVQQEVSASESGGHPVTAGMAQLSFLQTEYASTYQRLQDFQVQRTQRADVLSVEQRAIPPATPVDPDPVRYVLVGSVAGLLVAVLVALLAEGLRTRVRRSWDLAQVAGTNVVLDFTRDVLPGAGRPYGFLARIGLERPPGQPAAILIVGSTLGERVNDVGRELAHAVAASGRRVLVLFAPTPSAERWWRRNEEKPPSRVLVEPGGQEVPPARDAEFDLLVHCSLPPTLDPSSTWLRSTPSRAILVATRGRTRLGQVRHTVDMLHRVSAQVVAAVLLPVHMKPASRPPLAATVESGLPEARARIRSREIAS